MLKSGITHNWLKPERPDRPHRCDSGAMNNTQIRHRMGKLCRFEVFSNFQKSSLTKVDFDFEKYLKKYSLEYSKNISQNIPWNIPSGRMKVQQVAFSDLLMD